MSTGVDELPTQFNGFVGGDATRYTDNDESPREVARAGHDEKATTYSADSSATSVTSATSPSSTFAGVAQSLR